MRGHVRKRGSKWAVVVDAGRDPATGKRRQKWVSGFDRKKDAESALAKIIGQLEDGTHVEPSKLTTGAYLAQWLEVQRSQLRPSTLESYRATLTGRVIPALGAIPLQQLSAASIDVLYANLLREGRSDGKGGLSARSVRYTHTILRRALGDAVRKQLLVRNPTDAADPPSASAAKAPEMRTWTRDELRAFLAHVADDRLFAAWRLAASTGMRRGEVLGLRWRDLDLDAGTADVVQALVDGQYAPRVSLTKSGRGRSVALDAATVLALREHRKAQLEERVALGPAWEDHGLVFVRENGVPIWPRSFSRAFERHVEAAGLPRIRLHDLRHGHATLALRAGVHPKVVQERLGHASIAITLDIYSHVTPAMQADAADRVAALFAADGA